MGGEWLIQIQINTDICSHQLINSFILSCTNETLLLAVNKDLGFKAKVKDLGIKAKAKDLGIKVKDLGVQGQGLEDRSLRTGKDQGQGHKTGCWKPIDGVLGAKEGQKML